LNEFEVKDPSINILVTHSVTR